MVAISTPWGPSQHIRKIADGIEFVSTAGHGGFRLSPERQQVLAKRFPKFKPFTGNRMWLEEDCDALLVYVLFPEHFEPERVEKIKAHILANPYYAACHSALAS